MKIAIIGATGYGGVELMRILQQHPHASIHSIHSSSSHSESITNYYPQLQGITTLDLEPANIAKLAEDVDCIFTATPSGVSAKLIPGLLEHQVKVIDLSGDFRLQDPTSYETWYGKESPDPAYLQQALYGLSEWIPQNLTNVQLLSNPGCFPTAVLLGLAPVIKEKWVYENSIIIDAKTGVSGAGKGLSQASHYAETNDNFKIYKVNAHQHTPEIEQQLSQWNPAAGAVTFTTHLAPMTRGIMATMYMEAKEDISIDDIITLYKENYEHNHFVRIRDKGSFPSTKEVYGSNFCDIGHAYDERTNRIMVVSVIDNLMKGAAGQAVQNMNRMFGLDETTGLEFIPVYP
ncbi:N-acetyl-gamma-glutamyl-phosphate reductase [Ornithinibacillus gellani]|uniref:N-acetyl-gamma-glutamyl-phosphate reductase n=1 Tax=Ornithinibacillus gellani TaxID=2293253 RepID=UPI000F495399|nr:N-acetyl-gamma-glutamyl-phosphate reductase [Ornithinibacillus gellani]TQS75771.1 N-acetyl-gamma-glutamyl-phosphate reductase [Ornithinibacillus gellani]